MADKKEVKVFCRQCGGDLYHSTVAEKVYSWSEENTPVSWGEMWAIVECGGCRTSTFLYERWFSEDMVETDEGPEVVVHRTIYPPAPTRKLPEWSNDHIVLLGVPVNDGWVFKLHRDVYAAIGLDALNLAAMGVRTIVDHIVSWKAGDFGGFKAKLERMRDTSLISSTQVDVIFNAFDAGSAAAHRGYSPEVQDIYTMLDIAEHLMGRFYIEPAQLKIHEKAADALKKKTPQRRKP